MHKATPQQIQTSIQSDARDNLGPHDPDVMRQHMLNLGATEEQADQAARFCEKQNRRNIQIRHDQTEPDKAELAKAS